MSLAADLATVQRRVAEIAGDVPARAASPGSAAAHTRAASFAHLVHDEALRAGVQPALVSAVVQAESGFDPGATSPAGAAGLMQLMPQTARALGIADPYDPVANVRGGAVYLRELLDRFGGDVRLAVAAYDAGPDAVARYGGVPPFAETRSYVTRVLETYRAALQR